MPALSRDPLLRAFGALLSAHREAADLSRLQLAEALGCTPQWIGKVENGDKPPSEAFSIDLDTFFRTPADTFRSLWTEIKREGRHVALPPGFPAFLKLELLASARYIFSATAVPGILQTQRYAYQVLKVGRTISDAEQLVVTRLERQEILRHKDPPSMVVIVDELALRRIVGGPEVLKEQIAHIIDMAQMHNFTVQIVAAEAGAYAGIPGSFTMLSFDDRVGAVYVEGHAGDQVFEDAATVRKHAIRWNLIRGAAMSADDSLQLLHAMWESL